MGDAVRRWADELARWAIPEEIRAAVSESPWTIPTEVFARRADFAAARPTGVSWERADAALAPSGTVLDVGAGAGAASLALAAHTEELTAVDTMPSMLDALRARADALGLKATTIMGRWPDVADEAPVVDVVVCHHVAYNVADLDAFSLALTAHARRRVVLELTAEHPLRVLNPLWERLHGLRRPDGPRAEDAAAVLRETGIEPRADRWTRPEQPGHHSFADLVAITRRRLCLPTERDEELAAALVDLGVEPENPRELGSGNREVVTLWWDVENA
jgi:SAM-dependent methyltransferase